jgi:hypothetical protein
VFAFSAVDDTGAPASQESFPWTQHQRLCLPSGIQPQLQVFNLGRWSRKAACVGLENYQGTNRQREIILLNQVVLVVYCNVCFVEVLYLTVCYLHCSRIESSRHTIAVHVWERSGTLSIPAGSPRAVGTVSLSSGIKLSVSGW